MKKILSLFTAAVCLLQFSSCATIISGNKSPLVVRSQPSGAEVLIDGVRVGTTPLFADIRRMENHEIRVTKAGFVEASETTGRKFNPWAAGNVIFGLFGIFGLLVDASTGAVFSPKSDEIHVRLTPEEAAELKAAELEAGAGEKTLSEEASMAGREGTARTKAHSGLRPSEKISRGWAKTKSTLGVIFKAAANGTKNAFTRLAPRRGQETGSKETTSGSGSFPAAAAASARAEEERLRTVRPAVVPAPSEDKTKLRKKDGHPLLNLGAGGVSGFIVNAMRSFTPGAKKNSRKKIPAPEAKPVKPPAPAGIETHFSAPAPEPVLAETAAAYLQLAQSPATKAALKEPAYRPLKTVSAVRIVEPRASFLSKEPPDMKLPGAEAALVMPGRGEFKDLPHSSLIKAGAQKPLALALELSPPAGANFGLPKGGPLRPAIMVSELVEEAPVFSAPSKRASVVRIVENSRVGPEPRGELFIEDPAAMRVGGENEEEPIARENLEDASSENFLRSEDESRRGPPNGKTGGPAYSVVRII